jgi:seryl-tRNA synthetase
MIDIKLLRENPELIRASQTGRGEDAGIVDQVLALDEKRRAAINEFEALRAEQNTLSKAVGGAKGDEKAALLENAKDLANKVKAADSKRAEIEAETNQSALRLSNLLDPAAPIGGEADFVIIEHVGTPREFSEFEPKDHVELGKLLGAIDTERGAKVSGSRSYYLTGVGALLEFALVNYAISSAVKAGFTPVIPPVLVNPAAMEGTGFLGQAAENVYHLEKDGQYLVGTSEVPLAAFHMDEILPADKLPMRYAGYSTCFRREAGSYGADVKGLNRLHQFDKIEIVTIEHPEKSYDTLMDMVCHVENILIKLELPYRILRLCGGDMSFNSALTFDFETWSAAQGRWLEVSSVSNFETFQTNRMKLRYRDEDGKTRLAHTLNGSALALARIVATLLENNQTPEGIRIPDALRKYTGFDLIR